MVPVTLTTRGPLGFSFTVAGPLPRTVFAQHRPIFFFATDQLKAP
jgi:hypothetical protein